MSQAVKRLRFFALRPGQKPLELVVMTARVEPLRIFPLGGLGEVGMNCMALECAGDVIIIDCGTSFPADDYGIDVVHPRFDWLVSHRDRVRGVVLTHGHEDHIGALPYLLAACAPTRLDVYGPKHALRLVERRLAEHELEEQLSWLHVVRLGQPVSLGCFTVRTLRVSHSIADATALVIDSPAGRIIHTGDFNFDPEPSDGEHTDEAALEHWGNQGVDLLMSDSTNIDVRGEGGSEALVEQELEAVIGASTQRVFVALFASNIQRLIALGRIAQRCKRRIVLLGRSLAQHVEVAKDLGYLDWPHQLELPVERLSSYPRGEVLILCSGTQAESGSAMAKLAADDHRFARIQPGDTVVFSSRVIPGGERHVSELQDDLARLGAKVISRLTHPGVHTSGHACRQEQRRMLQLVRPRAFLPVHGTLHHLTSHAVLAKECGVSRTLVVENGQAAILQEGYLEKGAAFTVGTVAIEWSGVPLLPDSIKLRRDLGRYGTLHVGVACAADWSLSGEPRIQALGLPQFGEEDARPGELTAAITRQWSSFRARQVTRLERELERFVRRHVEEEYGLRPVVTTQVWGRGV